MSLSTALGRQSNLLDETPEHAHQLVISQPLLSNGELEKLRQVDHDVFQADTLDATWPVDEGVDGPRSARWSASAARPVRAASPRATTS